MRKRMSMTVTIAQWLVRITGVLELILGLLFWTGDALNLIPVHMLLGTLLVLALWLLAASASQLGVAPGLTIGAALLGLIVLVLGFTQTSLLPGGAHWLIQVLHLLVGIAAVASGEMIGGRLRRGRAASSAA
jgi:hypothetical protein